MWSGWFVGHKWIIQKDKRSDTDGVKGDKWLKS